MTGLILNLSLIVFLFAQTANAHSFLTFSEYYALTPQKQMEYISSVRQLAMNLESNPYLKAEVEKNQILYVYFLKLMMSNAEASQLVALCDVKSATFYTDDQLLSKIENLMNCSEKSAPGQPNYFLQVVPNSAEILSNEYKNRIQSGQLNRGSRRVQEANGIFSNVISNIQKGVIIGGGDFSRQSQILNQNIQETENLFLNPNVTKKAEARINSQVSKKSVKSMDAQNKKSKELTLHLCLYAGFVISKNDQPRCQPMSQLPENFDSASFFDRTSFICTNPTSVMCNPLLFGFESVCEKDELKPCYNKKPLCIARSSSATKKCLSLATSKNTLAQVEDVWKSPNGETLYTEYVKSLESLCDSKNIESRKLKAMAKNDIIQTCKVAFEVFQDHVDRKFLPQKLQQKNPQGQK